MSDEPKPEGRSYQIGNVGDSARIAQGENISWVEGVPNLPNGQALKQQFDALLGRIAKDSSLDEDTRTLARAKTEAIAEGLVVAQASPGVLRRALIDAKSWFSGAASGTAASFGVSAPCEHFQVCL
jgi:hypothetical protein